MIRAVIFDFDGTVADTIPAITKGLNLTMAQYGYPLHTEAEVRTYINNGPRMLVRRALPTELAQNEALLDRVLADYDRLYKTVCTHTDKPYDGVAELIAALRADGIRIGVLSNKQDPLVKLLCGKVLPELTDAALGSLPNHPNKPDPYLPLRIAADLGVDPLECILVGDSDVDIATAKAAGMTHIGVTWGYRDKAFLRAHGAMCTVDTPEQLRAAIDQMRH